MNSAEWPELAQLPGIGETLAKRIIDSRTQDGPFLDRTDIQRVRGIGPRTTEKLLPFMIPVPDTENIAGSAENETKS
ncbi:MAG: helix-hairpin-helix domain-containing protein [Pirellulales bacterium]